MGILSWLKRRRPVELDEDDFKEEIRAHLAIAAKEKIADGADRRRRALRGAEGIRQRDADDRSGPQRLDPALARGAARSRRATSATRSARSRRTRPSRSPSSAC